jgi:glutathione S-transferase
MLAHKITFDEELISFKDWEETEKAKCIATLNPAGHLPVLTMDGKNYSEHISICRYLARKVRVVVPVSTAGSCATTTWLC